MRPPNWSLKALFAAILVLATCLAALRHPTEEVAFAAGMALSGALLVAIAIAIGTNGARRCSSLAFAVVCMLVLYLNDRDRQLLTALPSFSQATAERLNEQFGWTEWKGPPRTFVYWSSDDRVRYVSFDGQGNFRSLGSMTLPHAERSLRGAITLSNLPTECPLPRPSLSALRDIVSVASALVAGLLAGLLARTSLAAS